MVETIVENPQWNLCREHFFTTYAIVKKNVKPLSTVNECWSIIKNYWNIYT